AGRGRAIAGRGDGGQESQVFTAGGQVWSGDLRTLLAIIDVDGTEIEYVPSRERVYVSDGARLNEIDATTYSVLGTRLLTRGTGIGAVRADAAGATLYVGTNLTVDVLDLTQPPSPVVPPPSLVVGGGHVRAASGAPLLHATEAPLEAPESTGRASTTGAVFRESFDGNPGAPEPWRPAHWDVTVYSHAPETWHTLTPAPAMHGDDCAPPPATHHASAYEDAVFLCRDHVMTVIDAGRASQLRGEAAIVLTPNHLIDFSAGEARLRFDLSTLRTSENDWIDLWITPFEDHLQLPGGARRSIVHNGTPPRGVYLWMGGHWTPTPTAEISPHSMFAAQVVGRGRQGPLPHHPSGYETLLGPSAARRETFELRLSRTHIRFGLPNYDFWWIDTEIEPLDWSQGVVQFSHHSVEPYPSASCTFRGRPCTPTTWHWDNVEITPAVPFTLLRADRPFVDATTSLSVTFPAPAPDRAFLRFFGIGHRIEISVDGGLSWRPARPQYDHAIPPLLAGRFTAYWTPVPAGTTTVHLRAQPWTWGTSSFPWLIRALSIWAPPPLFVQLDAGAAA
ncbi:MAG TPA: hypothetical protein VGW38_29385, partial [Chloroflexota bacterium]|nr:hypothetical protein [Chloroflexota bacterium]